ncbi:hypothetical protein SEA_SPELLY_211 [Streptomyces phage Spelly]|nr:hypothetical protein SEA_SPELLY_211 [Streptomyces phage Spelly]
MSTESQVSVSLVKTSCTPTNGFKCTECGYEFPYHADNCSYHPSNLGK